MINFKVSPVSEKIAIGKVKRDDILHGGIGPEIPDGWELYMIVGPFDQFGRWMQVLMASNGGRYFHAGEAKACHGCDGWWPVVYFDEKRWCPQCGKEH
jgi:hypothetical protein